MYGNVKDGEEGSRIGVDSKPERAGLSPTLKGQTARHVVSIIRPTFAVNEVERS